jgi:hypothetical protein
MTRHRQARLRRIDPPDSERTLFVAIAHLSQRLRNSTTNATYKRVSVTAQSTWKKSVAHSVAACARRNVRQPSSCARGGTTRWLAGSCGSSMPRRGGPDDGVRLVLLPLPGSGSARPAAGSGRPDGRGIGGLPCCLGLAHLAVMAGDANAATCPGDDAVRPQRPGQNPCKRAQHSPIPPRQSRPRMDSAQYRELVPQHEYFHVLRRGRAGE